MDTNLCRICLTQDSSYSSIFECQEAFEFIKEFCNILVFSVDLSFLICKCS